MSSIFSETVAPLLAEKLGQPPLSQSMRDSAHEVCPAQTMNKLFEGVLDGILAKGEFLPPTRNDGAEHYPIDGGFITIPSLFGKAWSGGVDAHLRGSNVGFADFDPNPENRKNTDNEYFSVNEMRYGFTRIAAHPEEYLGHNLMLQTIGLYGAHGLPRITRSYRGHGHGGAIRNETEEALERLFNNLLSLSTPSDLYMRVLALGVHTKALKPETDERAALTPGDLRPAMQWFQDVNANPDDDGRCPFKGYLTMLMRLPLYKGTPREVPCALAYMAMAKDLIQKYPEWRKVGDKITATFSHAAAAHPAFAHLPKPLIAAQL